MPNYPSTSIDIINGIRATVRDIFRRVTVLSGNMPVSNTATVTTDANGRAVITHGLNQTPTCVLIQALVDGGSPIPTQIGGVVSITSTTFTVRLLNNYTGAAIASTAGVQFRWIAFFT